mmetsp:Transcript_27912/g.57152  ORF Transcript_27912/g.57152 Transcript_27912/m.57152 type:complete len:224 (+) Transcript_27912:880-1551(+)
MPGQLPNTDNPSPVRAVQLRHLRVQHNTVDVRQVALDQFGDLAVPNVPDRFGAYIPQPQVGVVAPRHDVAARRCRLLELGLALDAVGSRAEASSVHVRGVVAGSQKRRLLHAPHLGGGVGGGSDKQGAHLCNRVPSLLCFLLPLDPGRLLLLFAIQRLVQAYLFLFHCPLHVINDLMVPGQRFRKRPSSHVENLDFVQPMPSHRTCQKRPEGGERNDKTPAVV